MFVYWLIFLAAAIGVAVTQPDAQPRKSLGALGILLLAIAFLIGLRFQVGADWEIYQILYRNTEKVSLGYILSRDEAGFALINWLSTRSGAGIWLVNLACAALFCWGLGRFVRSQPDPALAIVSAVPYLIVVVAMGYTRQAVAIGLIMAGLASFFRRGSILVFAAYVVAAAMFHRTAVVAFPLVALANPRNRVVNLLVVLAFAYLLWDMFLADSMQHYIQNYVDAKYSSQGAAIRLAMSSVAAFVLLSVGKKMGFDAIEYRVWRNFSFVTLALVVALGVSLSSTAVDRLALYVLPLQLAVFGRFPALGANWRAWRTTVVFAQGTALLVWLMFAVHARHWLPYQFYPLEAWR